MKKILFMLLFAMANGTASVASGPACENEPTRGCALAIAAEAIAPVSAAPDNPSYQEAWQAWAAVINTAARADETDLALSLVNKADKNFSRLDIGDLAVALKLAGREAEAENAFQKFMEDWPSYDGRIGPALIAAGRTAEFDDLFKDRDYSPETLAEMKIAGLLIAGKIDDAQAALKSLGEDERPYVAVNVLSTLRTELRLDTAAPLVPYYDLTTVDGVAYCALIASGSGNAQLSGQCFEALSALPSQATRDGFYISVAAPEMIGALAMAGDWQKAQALARSLPEEGQKMAFAKIAQFSKSPELVPDLKQAFADDSPDFPRKERGEYLVRLLVMAGMKSEAGEMVASAPDDKTRDDWSRWQAEALAETGNMKEAMPLAQKIKDPVIRARALASVSERMDN